MTAGARRALVLALPAAWMLLFFAAPFAIVLSIGFAEPAEGIPPYASPLRWAEDTLPELRPNFANFALLFEDPFYAEALLRSLRVAAISATLCLHIGYPMALALTRVSRSWRRAAA